MRRLLMLVGLLAMGGTAWAQEPRVIALGNNGGVLVPLKVGADGTLATTASIGDVMVGAETCTDADDGTIAAGQTCGLTIAMNYVFDGTNMKRFTVGTAGTASAQVVTVQGITSMTPLLATVTCALCSTAAKQPALGTAGTASSDVISVQGIASMTPLAVSQATASSLKGQMQVLDSGGTAATDTTAHAVKVLSVDASGTAITPIIADVCASSTATFSSVAISQTTSTVVKAGTSAKKTYVCGAFIQADDAEKLSLVAGTGSVCGTNTVAIIGATSAANGMSGGANGGWVLNVGGFTWANTTVNADDLCLLQSGSGRVAGVLRVAVQ